MDRTPTQTFASQLRKAIKTRYGRLVSAAFISRQLEQISTGAISVSSEAVRKWLTGSSVPRASILVVLERLLEEPLLFTHAKVQVRKLDRMELELLQREVKSRLDELNQEDRAPPGALN